MWTAPEKRFWIDTPCLFDSRIPRCDLCTSSKEPAALTMIKAPRKPDASLLVLESQHLWRNSKAIEVEHDWMAESSVRAVTPSYSSDSDQFSILSETASIASASSKASSIWSTFNNVATTTVKKPSWWESKSKRIDSPTPRTPPKVEDHDKSKTPVLKSQTPTNGSSRDSKVLANRSMWETVSLEPGVTPSFVRKPSTKPVALADVLIKRAISKTSPTLAARDLSQCGATFPEWAPVLEEALPKLEFSAINKGVHFNSAVRHPVFFLSSMSTTSSVVHPAATGYTRGSREQSVGLWRMEPVELQDAVVDSNYLWTAPPSARPGRADIFDTKCETTNKSATALFSLPALTSFKLWEAEKTVYIPEKNWILISSKPSTSVWSKATAISEAAEEQSMWAARVKGYSSQRSLFTDAMEKSARCTSSKPTIDLPELESAEFWQPHDITDTSRDCIRESVVQSIMSLDMPIASPKPAKQNQMWVAPKSLDALEVLLDETGMWKASTATHRCSSSLFSNIKPEPLKRTPSQRVHELKKLESDAFWQPADSSIEQKDWIRVAVAPVVDNTQLLWEPTMRYPASGTEELSLWKSQIVEEVEETTAFANPHVEPWVKPNRAPSSMGVIESKSLWRPSCEVPQSPRSWLVRTL